ncbi:MAG: hypothetical protein ISS01_02425 [Nanoarchaeota archaeon]|nr:hypothetical protein [Nanoarchaeota archaeon]
MFWKKKKEEKKIDLRRLSTRAKLVSTNIEKKTKRVAKMDKKQYLKYYIKILEEQINEASKILKEKKKKLKKLK